MEEMGAETAGKGGIYAACTASIGDRWARWTINEETGRRGSDEHCYSLLNRSEAVLLQQGYFKRLMRPTTLAENGCGSCWT